MFIEIVIGGESNRRELADGKYTLGRSSENDLVVPAPRVSKQHATVRIAGDKLFVADIGSRNGTEVAGEPIGTDEVEVAEGVIVSFAGALMRRADKTATGRHTLAQDNHVTTSLRFKIGQGYSSKARDRIVENSAALFELLASDEKASNVGKAACKFVSTCVKADRVVLLEDDGEGTSLNSRAWWAPKGLENAPLHLSTTIVNSVVEGRDAILVSDAMDDSRFGAQQSVMALNLRSAMAAPLFDHERVRGLLYVDSAAVDVRYTRDDLEVLSAVANAVAVKLRNLSFEREMRTAAAIQRQMLPETITAPEGYEIDAYQAMCRDVGGDLYASVKRSNGNVLLFLGDVSGKGVPAALAMGAAMVLVGVLSEIEGDVLSLVDLMHRRLFRSLAPEQFITMFVGELNPETGHIEYVNAGHEHPLIVRQDGSLDQLASTGLPLAMIEDSMLDKGETTLEPGELLTVFSDGIPEATARGEEFLGLDALEETIKTGFRDPLPDIRKKIIADVQKYLGGARASDDVTLLLFRRCAG